MIVEFFRRLFGFQEQPLSIYEVQQYRKYAAEKMAGAAYGGTQASGWDAERLRRQNRMSARVGEVIPRPFSRLDSIERSVRRG